MVISVEKRNLTNLSPVGAASIETVPRNTVKIAKIDTYGSVRKPNLPGEVGIWKSVLQKNRKENRLNLNEKFVIIFASQSKVCPLERIAMTEEQKIYLRSQGGTC